LIADGMAHTRLWHTPPSYAIQAYLEKRSYKSSATLFFPSDRAESL
jgi:hypothetical protein